MEVLLCLALSVLSMLVSTRALDWQSDPDTCGRRNLGVSTRIKGGQAAEEYAWPWQAAMLFNGTGWESHLCGGSLIDPWWILTAAHCVEDSRTYLYRFKMGSTSLSYDTDFSRTIQAAQVYIHPDYFSDPYNVDNDVALFKLAEPFNVTTNYEVNTVCLPTRAMRGQFKTGQVVTVTGWGSLGDDSISSVNEYPDELQEAEVKLYDQGDCNEDLNGIVTDNMVCAGYPEGGKDSCSGDSGGPLVGFSEENNEQYYQIGVVSFGQNEGCGLPNSPGVYADVTRYEKWIRGYVYGEDSSGSDRATIIGLSVTVVLLVIGLFVVIALWISTKRSTGEVKISEGINI